MVRLVVVTTIATSADVVTSVTAATAAPTTTNATIIRTPMMIRLFLMSTTSAWTGRLMLGLLSLLLFVHLLGRQSGGGGHGSCAILGCCGSIIKIQHGFLIHIAFGACKNQRCGSLLLVESTRPSHDEVGSLFWWSRLRRRRYRNGCWWPSLGQSPSRCRRPRTIRSTSDTARHETFRCCCYWYHNWCSILLGRMTQWWPWRAKGGGSGRTAR
jgi:hypothetical protein